jgi:hypothetical protein
MFRYYTGVCKVEQNKDLEEAAELLVFASARGVPDDVYYYLGEANRKLYDFKKALNYYIQFDKIASRSLAKKWNSKMLIIAAENALQITSDYNPFKVINVTFINLMNPVQRDQIKMTGGELRLKPEEFYAGKEDREDLNSLMFYSPSASKGSLVYFSSLARNGKDGFQIMQAKRGVAGKWTDIQEVTILNSEFDEILPYYDPIGRDLYFASNGREGLGGFDLYCSHFDEEKKEWSQAVNLGFPVNSVYDDYLLLPGNDLGMVIIFSGRQAADTALAVYRVQFSEPKKSLTTSTPQEIRNIANLGNTAADVLTDFTAFEKASQDNLSDQVQSDKREEQSTIDGEKEVKKEGSDHQKLISSALQHQSVADSLTELATTARIRVRESEDPNEKWLYQKQILVWEKKALEEQDIANEFFASIGNRSKSEIPETIETDTVINGITVYNYIIPDSDSVLVKNYLQKADSKKNETVVPVGKENSDSHDISGNNDNEENKQEGFQKANSLSKQFEILEFSPYSISSPIPIDGKFPEGPLYKIQLVVLSKVIEQDAFGGLSPISGERIPERNLTKYYAGNFRSYDDVQKALPKVREMGYNDAFIVGWYKGTKMDLEKLRKLEE